MTDYYVDNNKTIYATARVFNNGIVAGGAFRTYIGLQDLADLAGQSTVFVNWVRFEWQGHATNGGVGESYGHSVAGILPYDVAAAAAAATDYNKYEDFQEVKGWPIKNSRREYYSYTGSSGNSLNSSKTIFTYNPKNALLINREQALYFAIFNEYGQDISGVISITCQLKRGD